MNIRFQLRALILALAVLVLLGADTADGEKSSGCMGSTPDPPVLNDPSFDLWCGDELCSWEVEEGVVMQVDTWTAGDHGVGMMSNPTVISQLSRASSDDTDCLWFSLMVDSEAGVTVQLEVDFQDDGINEYEHPIPSTDWTEFSYHIRPPTSFDRIRFRIRKTGDGDATLAQIMADRDSASMCESQDPLEYDDLPLGASCTGNTECDSGICQSSTLVSSGFDTDTERSTCGACTQGSCGGGLVCGMGFTDEGLPSSTCVAEDSKPLGEACIAGEECASDVCCSGRCSECCSTDHACPDGGSCDRRWSTGDAHTRMMPYMCDADDRDRAGGAACMGPSDCTSTTCGAHSELRLCDAGGNPCETDDDCPGYDFEPGRCVTLGPYDGRCLLDERPGVP
jgi:hypothetical protein